MKKLTIILPIITAILGLFIGYLVFSNNTENDSEHQHSENAMEESEVWTCSMHPQVRQNEPGSCPICGMDLIPLANNSSTNSNPYVFEMTEDAVQLANIQTMRIGDVGTASTSSLKLNGKMQANESEAISMVAHLPGRIEKLYVSFTGEKINKGDKIATIYSPELVAAQRELIEAKKLEDISPEILQAAKNKLKYWKVGDKFINQVLDNETVTEKFTIYAEQSGVVMDKKVTVGDYLKVGDVLFNLQNLNKLWALFDVYENDLFQISLGTEVSFTTPSLSNKTFKAKIIFIDPVINASTRVATIRAEINNSNQQLKPEMFISGSIKKLENKSGSTPLTVPKSAVLYTGERSIVYVKVPNTTIPSYEFREIGLGESTGDFYIVNDGLENGEDVVVNGAFVIDAAAQLNNQASMMNRQVKVNATNEDLLPDYTEVTPKEFKEQIESLTILYLDLKDALVSSNFPKAVKTAEQFNSKIKDIDMMLLEGEAHNYWMQQEEALLAHSQEILKAKDLDNQREQFYFLSQSLIKTIKVYGINQSVFYVQHCPMANENNGADWISKDLTIKNPYFGDAMLSCGQTQDTIDENFKNILESSLEFKPMQNHNH